MAIQAGEDTFYQANRGVVQDGMILNIDPAVKDSYTGSAFKDLKKRQAGLKVVMANGPEYDTEDGGGCVVFDGTNDSLNIDPTHTLTGLDQVSSNTISLWYKIVTHQAYNGLLGNGNSGFRNPWIWSNSNGKLTSDQYIGSEAKFLTSSSSSLSSGVWRHIAYAIDGGSSIFRLYINGSLDNTMSTNGGNTNNGYGNISIGSNSGTNNANAKIACVHLYNRTLTAAEVLHNYNATRHRFGV